MLSLGIPSVHDLMAEAAIRLNKPKNDTRVPSAPGVVNSLGVGDSEGGVSTGILYTTFGLIN